jgi:hypothetical protein
VGGVQSSHGPIDDLPGFLAELHAFDILGKIIQPAQQTERIPQGCEGCVAQAGRDSQPGLLAHLNHDAILDGLNVNSQRGVPAGPCPGMGGNLDGHFVLIPQHLGMHVAAIELCHQGMCDIIGFDVSVKDSSVHVFDYNPLYRRRRFVVVFNIFYLRKPPFSAQ